MPDLVVTAANVLAGTNAQKYQGTAGAAVTAGEPVYQDTADGLKFKPAQANALAASRVRGIALNDAADEQPLAVILEGDYDPGATVVVGQVYVLSAAAAGGVAPVSDLVSTNYVTILGVATTASNIAVDIQASETQKA